MRVVGTGGDGVEFVTYYFVGEAGGAESIFIGDANVSEVEVEVGGEEACGLGSKTEQVKLVVMGSEVRSRCEEVCAFQVFAGDVYIIYKSPYRLARVSESLTL